MPTPLPPILHLCVSPPFTGWTVARAFGEIIPGTSTRSDETRLRTSGTGEVLAACVGTLSAYAPRAAIRSSPQVNRTGWKTPPAKVSLYLHMPMWLGLLEPFAAYSRLLGFLYRDIETASIIPALGALLDGATIGSQPLNRTEALDALLSGSLRGIRVPAGQEIGIAAASSTAGAKEFGFTAIVRGGPTDPSKMYDLFRDDVIDGQPAVDDFLAVVRIQWPVIDPTLSDVDVVTATQSTLYPFTILENVKASRPTLTPAQWREVGNNQKALYRERLLVRTGHAPAGSIASPFEFNDADVENVFQLEAIAEYYANFFEPWLSGFTPILPGATVLQGTGATSVASAYTNLSSRKFAWVTLPGTSGLSGVRPNRDMIFLASSVHPSRMYRLIDVDLAGHRVMTEGDPAIPSAGSEWAIDPYHTVDLLDPAGVAATIQTSGATTAVLALDGTSDLTRVWTNDPAKTDILFDTIQLDGDTARTTKRYKIRQVDPAARTVTVDGVPNLTAGSSKWHINLRPTILLIDPIGGRLSGTAATANDPAHPTRIQLDSTVSLDRVNENFDTIYIPADTARPSRTYRIVQVDATNHWVEVDAVPGGLTTPTAWHLPGGISGVIGGRAVTFPYNLKGGAAGRGWDHFDGLLFVVQHGEVQFHGRWSSYTARNYPNFDHSRSSSKGNKLYEFSSYKSGRGSKKNYTPCNPKNAGKGKPFRNYSLKVVDFGAGARVGWSEIFDGVREARWYFEATTQADNAPPGTVPPATKGGGPGKTEIRFHHSIATDRSCSSAGCMTSFVYSGLRTALVNLYNAERVAFGLTRDAPIDGLRNITNDQAIRIFEGCVGTGDVTSGQWNGKIVGRFWLIRPDERPL